MWVILLNSKNNVSYFRSILKIIRFICCNFKNNVSYFRLVVDIFFFVKYQSITPQVVHCQGDHHIGHLLQIHDPPWEQQNEKQKHEERIWPFVQVLTSSYFRHNKKFIAVQIRQLSCPPLYIYDFLCSRPLLI